MDTGPPVLDTRKVLLSHLLAKVWPLCQSRALAKDICEDISEDLTDTHILRLLEDDRALEEAVYAALGKNGRSDCKQMLGEKLFVSVAGLESELCAQITGMLLELDTDTIKQLLAREGELRVAVARAKREYLDFVQKQLGTDKEQDRSKKTEDVGEVLYGLVAQEHHDPKLAARLTGMLLELEAHHLETLMTQPDELRTKLDVACRALDLQCNGE